MSSTTANAGDLLRIWKESKRNNSAASVSVVLVNSHNSTVSPTEPNLEDVVPHAG